MGCRVYLRYPGWASFFKGSKVTLGRAYKGFRMCVLGLALELGLSVPGCAKHLLCSPPLQEMGAYLLLRREASDGASRGFASA